MPAKSALKKMMEKFSRDSGIDEYLEKNVESAGYGGFEIITSPVGTRITIYVTKPGLVIGRRGIGIRELTENLEKIFKLQNLQISVFEVEIPEQNARIMCNRVAQTVARGTAFRRAAMWTVNAIMRSGALGAEIVIAGKLRSERSHTEKYKDGVVPKTGYPATLTVREAVSDVKLKMGLYGIQVKIAIRDMVPPDMELIKDIEKERSEKERSEKERSEKEGVVVQDVKA